MIKQIQERLHILRKQAEGVCPASATPNMQPGSQHGQDQIKNKTHCSTGKREKQYPHQIFMLFMLVSHHYPVIIFAPGVRIALPRAGISNPPNISQNHPQPRSWSNHFSVTRHCHPPRYQCVPLFGRITIKSPAFCKAFHHPYGAHDRGCLRLNTV